MASTSGAGISDTQPGGWTSRTAFVLAAIGSAVGLGNLWRFPSEAGMNGGGAFVIFYIGCVALIGLPLLLSEMLIGRHGHASAVESTKIMARQSGVSHHWSALASIGMWGSFLILTFYSVVAAWVLYYIGLFGVDLVQNGIGPAFAGAEPDAISGLLGGLFESGALLVLLHAGVMAVTIFIVMHGVSGGIEKAALWLMPAFFLLLVAITIYSMATGDAAAGLAFLFDFAPERLLHGPVMLSALGQAFFSLSLGSAMMITYGAYAGERMSLPGAAVTVGIADTAVAVIAGLAIFPITFAAGLDVTAGPTLMFQSMPIAFQSMPGGALVGLIFFVMVFFAALTSTVALLEAPVARAMEVFGWGRRLATMIVGGAIFLIGIAVARSLSSEFPIEIFGLSLFDALDGLTGKILLPLSGFVTALFIGWRADRRLVASEHRLSGPLGGLWRFLVAWLCPFAVGLILIFGLFPI